MSYTRKNNKNVVLIRLKDATNKQIYYTVAAMIFGVIFGAILKTAATPEIITIFNDTIAGSIETMFMNALNMMIAPHGRHRDLLRYGLYDDIEDVQRRDGL